MKLQTAIRAALFAAIVAMPLAGAWWFTIRPVAGQETREHALHGAAALDHLKRDGQYDSLMAAMNQARFGVSRAENTPLGRAAWHAPNPAAGYGAYVTEEGVSVALNDKTYVSLSLRGLGYGHALRSVGPGEVSGDKQTINIKREGVVQEWYVNGLDGLEQGFTLGEPPGARSQGAPLRLTLEVSKGWRAVVGEDGRRVILRGADDQAVEYGKLIVRDSQGRNIPARLAVADEQVVIEAQDSGATYPLTIDPLFILQQKLTAPDGAIDDRFGYAVALIDDTLVVGAAYDKIGANGYQGSVYVFTRSGATWTLQQKLIANDGAAVDFFGSSVALDGDTLVVGASGDGFGGNSSKGSAYVFTRSDAIWTQQQKLVANDGAQGDHFGRSVTLDGDTLVVGAFGDVIGANLSQGSAYVFTRSGAIWTQQQKLIAYDGAPGDHLGFSVAFDGDTLVVGAPDDTFGGNISQGSVYVVNLPICPTLTFNPASLPNGIILFPYQQSVTVSGGIGPYQFALGSGAAPPGITMTSYGLLSGTPTTLGTYQFTVTATDLSSGCSRNQAYTLTITTCPSITITPSELPQAAMGSAYSQTLTATGGRAPYSFSVGKTFPSGLSLSQNGVLSGTPTTWGIFDFTVSVTDANGCSGSRDYTLNVALFGGGGGTESIVAPRKRRQQ